MTETDQEIETEEVGLETVIKENTLTNTRKVNIVGDLQVTKIVYYLYLKILKHIMNFMRQLCFRMTSLYKLSSVSRRNLVCLNYARMFSTSFKLNIKSSTINFDSLDDLKKKPVRFTTSPAYNLDPNRSAMPTVGDDTPWFQGPLVAFSLACFLIYFTMLR